MDPDLHETDFYSWSIEQSALLRERRIDGIDLSNVAEEIETLGRSEARALEAGFRLIGMHLLKAMYQPTHASAGWETTIVRERLRLVRILDDNPRLKPRRAELFEKAYEDARKEAASETRLEASLFPEVAPFTIEQSENEAYLPKSLKTLRKRDAERATEARADRDSTQK